MDALLENIRLAIQAKPHFCHETIPVDPEISLFYKVDSNGDTKNGRYLNIAQPTEEDLLLLNGACKPATFGLNQEDVLDTDYRKAGKMDTSCFSTQFDINKLRLLERISGQLLEGDMEKKVITAELYKLNVYGPGSFFKSHKDTPRGENMFGSLVVVFPTSREGGGLVLRHNDTEWTFDSASLLQSQTSPSIAYVAFFSDVEHEVLPVTSGYRVTLTYNLYIGDVASVDDFSSLPGAVSPVTPPEDALKASLAAALADPSFLPRGGDLGFGLSFMYPMKVDASSCHTLKTTAKLLKGSDALLMRICQELSLRAKLGGVYQDGNYWSLSRHRPMLVHEMITRFPKSGGIESLDSMLSDGYRRGKYIIKYGGEPKPDWGIGKQDCVEVLWVTPLTDYSKFNVQYMAHGNEPTIEYAYSNICLIVTIGPPGNRELKAPTS